LQQLRLQPPPKANYALDFPANGGVTDNVRLAIDTILVTLLLAGGSDAVAAGEG